MKTYSNPLPLPNQPRGMLTYQKTGDAFWWRRSGRRDFRATADGPRFTILDKSDSGDDLLIDYEEFPAASVSGLRLRIVGWPPGIRPALVSLTAFGRSSAAPSFLI